MIRILQKNVWMRKVRDEYIKGGGYITADGGVPINEVRLIPKASSTGSEGTIYYNSDDDHIYVAIHETKQEY